MPVRIRLQICGFEGLPAIHPLSCRVLGQTTWITSAIPPSSPPMYSGVSLNPHKLVAGATCVVGRASPSLRGMLLNQGIKDSSNLAKDIFAFLEPELSRHI